MKKAAGEKGKGREPGARPPKARTTKPPEAARAAPNLEGVAARLLALCPPGEPPALWKEAELKRRLDPAGRPLLAGALTRLQEQRQLLALTQGKDVFYLFAGPLRGWLENAPLAAKPEPAAVPAPVPSDLFAVYTRLVRQSGGFPDVKIAVLRAALDPESSDDLPRRLIGMWRAGGATFSQGDWSLADEATRAAAVLLHGERYLLVRLEEEQE